MIKSVNVPAPETPETVSETPDFEDRIRATAYAIWEEEGWPEGRAEDHWHRATALVQAEMAVEQTREPDWLKRGEARDAASETAAEPVGTTQPRRTARAA